jgi:hypothetical protein
MVHAVPLVGALVWVPAVSVADVDLLIAFIIVVIAVVVVVVVFIC